MGSIPNEGRSFAIGRVHLPLTRFTTHFVGSNSCINDLMVEYIVAIDVARARFPADAISKPPRMPSQASRSTRQIGPTRAWTAHLAVIGSAL